VKRVPPSKHLPLHYFLQFEVSKVNGLSLTDNGFSSNEEQEATSEEGVVVKGDDDAM